MAAKNGKKRKAAVAKYDRDRQHTLADAVGVVKAVASAKFDESVDLAVRLGVNPKHADQMVRGTVVLPHGLGKSKRVLAIAGADKQKEAQEAQRAGLRRDQVGSGDRSGRIRTYNFPQGRLTDHRIGFTSYKLEQIMNGELDEVVDALAAADEAARLRGEGETEQR